MKAVLLKKYPEGEPKEDDFEVVTVDLPGPLQEGEVLVRSVLQSADPYMRGRMKPQGSPYMPALKLGQPVQNYCIGVVEQSRHDDFAVGSHVTVGQGAWVERLSGTPSALGLQLIPAGVTPEEAVTFGGITGLSAYFGLLDIGKPKAGETVVVTGAAGGTGSIVVELAKIHGCRVIGLAGGAEKCRWVVDELKADGCVDYRSDNVADQLRQLCPNGINVVFDNVGGDLLDILMLQMANFGRVVCCGAIATYNELKPPMGRRNEFILITRNVRMEGFLVFRWVKQFPAALAQMSAWHAEGKLSYHLHTLQGIDKLPQAFISLFSGSKTGKVVVRVGDSSKI